MGPATRSLVVQNQVTDGATGMREDSTPAYLSTRTDPFCKSHGCAVPGTDMSTGAEITATCRTHGALMTNGQDNSPVDDHNPGLVTSDLWYCARSANGQAGYISEIWIRADGRGGLGLPAC